MDAHAMATSSSEKRKHKNKDDKDDERPTKRSKRSQQEPKKEALAGCSSRIANIEQISVYTAVTEHGHRGTLLIGNDRESLAVCIDLAQVIRESDPTGHLTQTLKDTKMPIDKKIGQKVARQNDLLTQKVNLIESELGRLRSEMARLTELATPHETGASTIQYPKPTSTHQGFRGHENRSS